MKLTRKTEYAIRAILYLSSKKPNTKAMAKEISNKMDIPKQFLAQVMLSLNHHGYVMAIRGANGGFVLAKKPAAINLLEIIEAIEGKVFLNNCLVSRNECPSRKVCPITDVWDEAQEALMKVLKKATFSSLVRKAKEKQKVAGQVDKNTCCQSLFS